MLKEAYQSTEHRMKGAVLALEENLGGIRTGRATPTLVEKLSVEYYGMPTPLMQLASISIPEARTIMIKPFDPASMKAVEKAILASDLGLNPNNDGKVIRLNLPPLNEERRRDLVKVLHHRMEEARVAIRNIRRDVMKDLREFLDEKMISEDELKRAEDELQKYTDKYVDEIHSVGARKEKEIMEV